MPRRRAGVRRAAAFGHLLALGGLLSACAGSASTVPPPSPTATAAPTPTASPSPAAPDAVLVGAGDIGSCDALGAAAITAHLVETQASPSAIVFTAGDNAYPSGSLEEFRQCYDPTWGAFRDRTRPAAGNHEWKTDGAAGYRDYFGGAVGDGGATWYAYDAGTWRVIVLDSECAKVGGCGPDSPEGRWLAAELATHPATCSLAIWHKPRFSSGRHGSDPTVAPLFAAVAAAGVDLVVNGHEHSYERFARLAPDGSPDPAGTREFVVGTGGASAYQFGKPLAGSEVRMAGLPAVLVLDLHPGGYDWRLVGGMDAAVLDTGSDTCRP